MMEYYEAMMDASEASIQTFQELPEPAEEDYYGRCLLDINGNQRQTVVKFPTDQEELAQVVTNEIINREDITAEDRALLYYSSEDYNELKAKARMESLACERDGTSKYLDDVFVEKCKNSQESLCQWVGSCDTVVEGGLERRGLERMANQISSNLRTQAQFHAVMEVLRAQDELLNGRLINGADPEEVRRVSLKATRVARHFARMIAKADALAVNADMNETSPKRISSSSTKSKSSSKKAADEPPSPTSKKGHKDKKDKATKKKDKDIKKECHHEKKEKKVKDKKDKDKIKDNEIGKEKPKSFFKQKFIDTKAGIASRMQRSA